MIDYELERRLGREMQRQLSKAMDLPPVKTRGLLRPGDTQRLRDCLGHLERGLRMCNRGNGYEERYEGRREVGSDEPHRNIYAELQRVLQPILDHLEGKL